MTAERPPLAGSRVLELAWAAPGPYCGLLLRQLGAEVIKIEPPSGDPLRGVPPYFAALNAGKRSIALDLKTECDRAVFHRLATRADALIEGFRPGVARRRLPGPRRDPARAGARQYLRLRPGRSVSRSGRP